MQSSNTHIPITQFLLVPNSSNPLSFPSVKGSDDVFLTQAGNFIDKIVTFFVGMGIGALLCCFCSHTQPDQHPAALHSHANNIPSCL